MTFDEIAHKPETAVSTGLGLEETKSRTRPINYQFQRVLLSAALIAGVVGLSLSCS